MNFKQYKTVFTLLIISLLITVTNQVKAQTEIFGLGGYLVNSSVPVARGDLRFDDNVIYGVGIDIQTNKFVQAEIGWSMSSSNVELKEFRGSIIPISDLYIHHFQAGALVTPGGKKKVSPFGLLTVGASVFHPTENRYEDVWRFSFTLGLGAKIYVSDKVGLRFQTRLIVPMQFSGGSIWVGSGGAGVGIGAYTTFVEADFSGGLFIRI